MAHDVFISYAVEDREVAEKVCRALEEQPIKCWMAPRDVPIGADFEESIIDAISESPILVLIHSAHSNASPHVKREIQTACAEGSKTHIIPLRIEAVSYGGALRYYLSSAQWLDASAPPLEEHLRRLVEHVHTHLPRVPEPDATPPPEQKAAPAPPAPPSNATPPQPRVRASEPPSLAPTQPELQMVATVNKPAATTEAAPASVGKSVNSAQPKWEGLSQAGCVILALAVFALIFSSSFCSGGPNGNANVNSGASVNIGTNAKQPPLNANQSGSVTNLNATPTPQSSPTPKASPTSTPSLSIANLSRISWLEILVANDLREFAGLSEVTVKADDTVVTLSGFVASKSCKQKAMKLANAVPDVTYVFDKMEERPSFATYLLLSDEQRVCKKK